MKKGRRIMIEKKKRAIVPSFLLGQLVATAQLLEEDVKHHDDPLDNSLTVAETYFNEMIENPDNALHQIEQLLEPHRERLKNVEEKSLVRDMTLIYRIKTQYQMSDEHLNEDEFFKGYYQQLKRYYDS